MALDYAALRRALELVSAQMPLAENRQQRHNLSEARRYLKRLAAPETLKRDQPVAWPTTRLLRQMLESGRDQWVADLLGCSRTTVGDQRRILGIDSHGFSRPSIDEGREAWFDEWRATLQAAGWQPPTQQVG